jgi:hypothetical protein
MTESDKIIAEIKHLIGNGGYSFWSIGITTDPTQTKEKLDHPPCWQMWAAGTESKAKEIVNYFVKTFPSGFASMRIRKATLEKLEENKMPYVFIY